ncbi:ABC transporter ATP-binding protein [Peptoniphilus lacrimalis]|uniref:ABC transporter ATP-binding protein n=1 Tax=Peptoniphilus lacrimalis TaxID=33031 RepID=UPI0032C08500
MKTIEIKNLEKSYGDFHLTIDNFSMESGTVMGLIGENGAGKTTLIKSILDLVKYKGDIKVFGNHMSKEIKEDIGVVFNEGFFTENLKIKEIEKIMASLYKKWDKDYFYKLIGEFRIPKDKKYNELSTGNKMKLKIINALSSHPKLLILDEPTSGLDPVIRDEILDIFFDFIKDENSSILFSTHITSDLEKIADYISFISQGKLVFSKNKDDLIYDYGILKTDSKSLSNYDNKHFLKIKEEKYNTDVLIKNKKEFSNKYKDAILEKPSIDQIMVFYERGK